MLYRHTHWEPQVNVLVVKGSSVHHSYSQTLQYWTYPHRIYPHKAVTASTKDGICFASKNLHIFSARQNPLAGSRNSDRKWYSACKLSILHDNSFRKLGNVLSVKLITHYTNFLNEWLHCVAVVQWRKVAYTGRISSTKEAEGASRLVSPQGGDCHYTT